MRAIVNQSQSWEIGRKRKAFLLNYSAFPSNTKHLSKNFLFIFFFLNQNQSDEMHAGHSMPTHPEFITIPTSCHGISGDISWDLSNPIAILQILWIYKVWPSDPICQFLWLVVCLTSKMRFVQNIQDILRMICNIYLFK